MLGRQIQNVRLLFSAAPTGNMFQNIMDEIFKELPYIFSIPDVILFVGYDR